MKYIYAFEKLQVWILSKDLVKIIYKSTAEFPKSEMYGICSQIRRSSISVASNIAEGSARFSRKDQAHFYQIAYSSLIELLSQIIITYELEMMEDESYQRMRNQINVIAGMLSKFRQNIQ